jgi:hypothetical protein
LTNRIHTATISGSGDYVEYCRETAKQASDVHDWALGGHTTAVGLLATEEEVAGLRRFGLEAKPGFTHQLPFAHERASVIVATRGGWSRGKNSREFARDLPHRQARPRAYSGEKFPWSSRPQLRLLPLGGKRLAICTANPARERGSECCGE